MSATPGSKQVEQLAYCVQFTDTNFVSNKVLNKNNNVSFHDSCKYLSRKHPNASPLAFHKYSCYIVCLNKNKK